MKRWLMTGSVTAGLAMLLVLGWLNREQFAPVETGSRAPDFTLPTLLGAPVSLAESKGQVVVLNLWATWCAPCREEMPALERLHRAMSGHGVRVLAVSLDARPGGVDDFGNPGGDVASFVREYDLTMPVLLDPDASVRRLYGAYGLPTTYVIDPEGRVRYVKVGAAEWDQPPWADQIHALLEH